MERGFRLHRGTVLGAGAADALPPRGGRGLHELLPAFLQVVRLAIMGKIRTACFGGNSHESLPFFIQEIIGVVLALQKSMQPFPADVRAFLSVLFYQCSPYARPTREEALLFPGGLLVL